MNAFKPLIALIIAAAIATSLVACGGKDDGDSGGADNACNACNACNG